MQSAGASLVVPKPSKPLQGLHRIPSKNPEFATPPPRRIAAAAIDLGSPAFWVGTWEFWNRVNVGNIYTQALEIKVYNDITSNLFVYTAFTYGGTDCERSCLDTVNGPFGVSSDPQPWIYFPPSDASEHLRDLCDPALNDDYTIDVTYAWLVFPWNDTGTKLNLQNAAYNQPFDNLIITRTM